MTDEDKKLLTEYLGERWRDKTVEDVFEWQDNRTFTTSQDMVDLVKKMVERGDWRKFLRFTWESWPGFEGEFTAWLITDPARTCELIAEWMEERHERL